MGSTILPVFLISVFSFKSQPEVRPEPKDVVAPEPAETSVTTEVEEQPTVVSTNFRTIVILFRLWTTDVRTIILPGLQSFFSVCSPSPRSLGEKMSQQRNQLRL